MESCVSQRNSIRESDDSVLPDGVTLLIYVTHSLTRPDTKVKMEASEGEEKNNKLLMFCGAGCTASDPAHNCVNMSAIQSKISPFKRLSFSSRLHRSARLSCALALCGPAHKVCGLFVFSRGFVLFAF